MAPASLLLTLSSPLLLTPCLSLLSAVLASGARSPDPQTCPSWLASRSLLSGLRLENPLLLITCVPLSGSCAALSTILVPCCLCLAHSFSLLSGNFEPRGQTQGLHVVPAPGDSFAVSAAWARKGIEEWIGRQRCPGGSSGPRQLRAAGTVGSGARVRSPLISLSTSEMGLHTPPSQLLASLGTTYKPRNPLGAPAPPTSPYTPPASGNLPGDTYGRASWGAEGCLGGKVLGEVGQLMGNLSVLEGFGDLL